MSDTTYTEVGMMAWLTLMVWKEQTIKYICTKESNV